MADMLKPPDPLAPSAAAVRTAQEELSEDKPWWVDLLEAPDEFFMGQSIKGWAKKMGEGDPLGAFGEFIRKSTPAQVIDWFLPGQPLTGEDVRFNDVWEAWGGDSLEGKGIISPEFGLMMIGEILTDPSSFLSFGATTPLKGITAGTRAAAQGGKLTKWMMNAERGGSRALPQAGRAAEGIGAGQRVFPWEMAGRGAGMTPGEAAIPMGLREAVESGMKSMVVWKVPWTQVGFKVPMPKSMELNMAKGLERFGDFLNTNALTAPVVRAFSRGAPVGIEDSATRAYVKEGVLDVAENAAGTYAAKFMPLLTRMLGSEAGELVRRDPEVANVVYMLSELGVSTLDDMSSIPSIIQEGVVFRKAKAKLERAIKENPEIRGLWNDAQKGNEQALRELHDLGYSLADFRNEVLDAYDIVRRPGIDMPGDPGFDFIARDIRRKEIAGEASTEEMAKRAAIAEQKPISRDELIAARKKAVDMFASVRNKHGDELMKGIQTLVEEGRTLMDDVAKADIAGGLINRVTEFYIPRNLSPEVQQTIHDQFMRSVARNHGKGGVEYVDSILNKQPGFARRRKITDLTTFEANHLFDKLGTKYSGRIRLDEFNVSLDDGGRAVEANLFDEGFIAGLKKIAGGDEAASFFEMNPFSAWHKRIDRAAQAHGNRAMLNHLVETGSPLVRVEKTLKEAVRAASEGDSVMITNQAGDLVPAQAFVVYPGKGGWSAVPEKPGQILGWGLEAGEAASHQIARDSVYMDMLRRLKDGEIDLNQAIRDINEIFEFDALAPRGDSYLALREGATEAEVRWKDLRSQQDEMLREIADNPEVRQELARIDERYAKMDTAELVVSLDSALRRIKPLSIADVPPPVRQRDRLLREADGHTILVGDEDPPYSYQEPFVLEKGSLHASASSIIRDAAPIAPDPGHLYRSDSVHLLSDIGAGRVKWAPERRGASGTWEWWDGSYDVLIEFVGEGRKSAWRHRKYDEAVGGTTGNPKRVFVPKEAFAEWGSEQLEGLRGFKDKYPDVEILVGQAGMEVDALGEVISEGPTAFTPELELFKATKPRGRPFRSPKQQFLLDVVENHHAGYARSLRDLAGEEKTLVSALEKTRTTLNEFAAEIEAATKAAMQKGEEGIKKAKGLMRGEARKVKGERQLANEKLRQVISDEMTPPETAEMLALARIHKEQGVLPLDELQRLNPEAAERIMAKHGDARVIYMDPEVSSRIWGEDGVIEYMRRPDKWGGKMGFKFMDENVGWWRSWTLMPPVFVQTRARDFVSNEVLLMQGGVSPLNIVKSWGKRGRINKALKDRMNGEAGSEVFDEVMKFGNGESHTVGEILTELQNHGLLDSSFVRDLLHDGGLDALRMGSPGAKKAFVRGLFKGVIPPVIPGKRGRDLVKGTLGEAGENSLVKAGYRLASYLDNQSKISGVIANMDQGMSLREAIEQTRKWTYDPRKGLTTFERQTMKRIFPFYAWTKFAVRSQVNAYFTRPGTVTFWDKLHRSAQSMIDMSPEEREAAIPDFIKGNLGIPWKRRDDGNIEYRMFGGYFPIGDLERIVNAVGEGDIGNYLGSNMTPFVKTGIENWRNKSFYTERDIEVYPGQPTEMFGIPMSRKSAHTIRLLRMATELNKLMPMSKKRADALIKYSLQTGTSIPTTFGEKLASSSISPFPKEKIVAVEKELKYKASQLQRERGKLRGQLRKAMEHPERPASKESMEVLHKLLAETTAREKSLEELRQKRAHKYGGSFLRQK